MKFPTNTEDGKSAPAPVDNRPMSVGKGDKPSKEDRRALNPVLEPVPGEKAKPKKYAKGGSIDGCAQRGKTKGRMV